MKQELLEHLIRACVREFLNVNENDPESVGMTAPPGDNQGSGNSVGVEVKEQQLRQEIKKIVNEIFNKR